MIRFDKRSAVVATVIAALVVQAAFAGFSFMARSRTESQLEEVRGQLEMLQMRRDSIDAQPLRIVAIDSGWQLSPAADVSRTLQVIQGLATEEGVELTGLKATKSKTEGKQPFQISGKGQPHQVCSLLASIEKQAEVLVVESGRVFPDAESGVAFDLDLATYHAVGEDRSR